jgi:DNA-binding IscR family transcriptional regulator
VAAQLVDAGILSTRVDTSQEQAFQLGRPAEAISASDVLLAVRGRRKPGASGGATAGYVEQLLDEIEGAAHKGAGDRTLAELLRDLGPPVPIDPPSSRG